MHDKNDEELEDSRPLVLFRLPLEIPSRAQVSLQLGAIAVLSRAFGASLPDFTNRVAPAGDRIEVLAGPGEEMHARWVASGGSPSALPPDPVSLYYDGAFARFRATPFSRWRSYLVTEAGGVQDITEPFPERRWWHDYGLEGTSPFWVLAQIASNAGFLMIFIAALGFQQAWAESLLWAAIGLLCAGGPIYLLWDWIKSPAGKAALCRLLFWWPARTGRRLYEALSAVALAVVLMAAAWALPRLLVPALDALSANGPVP